MNSDQINCLQLEAVTDQETDRVMLKISVGEGSIDKSESITEATIIEALQKGGYGDYFRYEEEINSILKDMKKLETSDLDAGSCFGSPPVAEARDAGGEVIVSDDKQQAFISITPPQGGKYLEADSLQSLLTEAGVNYGIDNQQLETLVQDAKQAQEIVKAQVAQGVLPRHGEDAQFIPLVKTANEVILAPEQREDGTIDQRELGNLPTVTANQPIMQKKPPTEGEKGFDVLGNAIDAVPGNDLAFAKVPGSLISPEDPGLLIAEIDGQPNMVNHGMKVDSVTVVEAVDLSTGNLDIKGNLLVKGDITESMKVKCSGDITVGGVIDSAKVKAKGSIKVAKGIVGHEKEDNELSASVIADHDIYAYYASYAKLKAKDMVHIDEQLIHCNTSSHDRVTVGNDNTSGSQIVGGVTKAKHLVKSDIVGSPAGVFTRFEFIFAEQEVEQKIAATKLQIEEKTEQLRGVQKELQMLNNMPPAEKPKEKVLQLKKSVATIMQNIGALEIESRKIKDDWNIAIEDIKLEVKHRINPYVVVKIGKRSFKSEREMEGGAICHKEADIKFVPKVIK